MTSQRPALPGVPGSDIVPCGTRADGGVLVLPSGWRVGDPPDLDLLAAATADQTGAEIGVPGADDPATWPSGLTILALIVGFAASALAVRRVVRHRSGTPSHRDARSRVDTGYGEAASGPAVQDDPVEETRDVGGRPDERGGPVRSRPVAPRSEPIRVTLGRTRSGPPPTPVRLPPHVAAALTRRRVDADGARSGPPPPGTTQGPETDRGGEVPEADAGADADTDAADAGSGRARRFFMGHSWLVGD